MSKFEVTGDPIDVYTPNDDGVSREGLNQTERDLWMSEMGVAPAGNYPEKDATETISEVWNFTTRPKISGIVDDSDQACTYGELLAERDRITANDTDITNLQNAVDVNEVAIATNTAAIDDIIGDSGSLNSTAFTGLSTTTIGTVSYCDYKVTNDVCHLECRVVATDSGGGTVSFQLNLGLGIKNGSCVGNLLSNIGYMDVTDMGSGILRFDVFGTGDQSGTQKFNLNFIVA